MQNNKSRWNFAGSILAVGLAMLQGGCGNLPPIEEAETIQLVTGYATFSLPEVDVDGNPTTRPGNMATMAFEGSAGCDWAVFFCAALFVPVSAVAGAAITAADTLPEEQAYELNDVTRHVSAGLNLRREFHDAMRAQAMRQGVNMRPTASVARVQVVVKELWWEVTVGNQVYLSMKVEVSAAFDGKTGKRRLSYRGKSAPASELLADNGTRIRAALETFMTEASEDIWLRLLDRD